MESSTDDPRFSCRTDPVVMFTQPVAEIVSVVDVTLMMTDVVLICMLPEAVQTPATQVKLTPGIDAGGLVVQGVQAPVVTAVHSPLAHEVHVPAHSLSQHVPLTQKPDAQFLENWHGSPFGRGLEIQVELGQ
jgi:hypothetical protein